MDRQKAKPMRNGFPTAVIALAVAALCAPAVAEAHHVDSGSAVCTLVGNVPPIKAQASFVGFASNNKPIAGTIAVDGKTVATVSGFTFTGSSATWQSAEITATPGAHHITGEFSWPHQDGMNGKFSADTNCPTPPKPTPPPSPSPSPTPSPSPSPTPSPSPSPTPSPS